MLGRDNSARGARAQQMLSRRSLLPALLAVALASWALSWALNKVPVKELETRYYRMFPRDLVLFIYDPTGSGTGLRNLELAYPAERQRHDGLRIVAQPIREAEILGSLKEVLDAFERTPNDPSSSKLFVRLSPPLRVSKKQFRADIDRQQRFTGEDRVRLLKRVYPLVGADERELQFRSPCEQFSDDLAYIEWTFGGFVLRMDDQTSLLLRECLAEELLNRSGLAR